MADSMRGWASATAVSMLASSGAWAALATDLVPTPPCKSSVVLKACADADRTGSASQDPQRRLQERLERNARTLEQRSTQPPPDADLGTVIIEEQREHRASPEEQLRQRITQPEYRFGRDTFGGTRADRDNFGMRFECGQSWEIKCKDQPGRPATTHWMNGR